MSAVIATTRGGMCTICHQDFSPDDEQLTHVGGENHDGYHKPCLENWLHQKKVCPLGCGDIDPNSPLVKTALMTAKLRSALVNTFYAASFGVTAALVGTGTVLGIGSVALAAGASAPIIEAVVCAKTAATVAATGIIAGALARQRGAAPTMLAAIGVATGTAGVIGAVGAAVKSEIAVGVGTALGIAITALGITGTVVGKSVDLIYNRVDDISRRSIKRGMMIGGLASLVTNYAISTQVGFATLPLISGIAAGVLSLIRR